MNKTWRREWSPGSHLLFITWCLCGCSQLERDSQDWENSSELGIKPAFGKDKGALTAFVCVFFECGGSAPPLERISIRERRFSTEWCQQKLASEGPSPVYLRLWFVLLWFSIEGKKLSFNPKEAGRHPSELCPASFSPGAGWIGFPQSSLSMQQPKRCDGPPCLTQQSEEVVGNRRGWIGCHLLIVLAAGLWGFEWLGSGAGLNCCQ